MDGVDASLPPSDRDDVDGVDGSLPAVKAPAPSETVGAAMLYPPSSSSHNNFSAAEDDKNETGALGQLDGSAPSGTYAPSQSGVGSASSASGVHPPTPGEDGPPNNIAGGENDPGVVPEAKLSQGSSNPRSSIQTLISQLTPDLGNSTGAVMDKLTATVEGDLQDFVPAAEDSVAAAHHGGAEVLGGGLGLGPPSRACSGPSSQGGSVVSSGVSGVSGGYCSGASVRGVERLPSLEVVSKIEAYRRMERKFSARQGQTLDDLGVEDLLEDRLQRGGVVSPHPYDGVAPAGGAGEHQLASFFRKTAVVVPSSGARNLMSGAWGGGGHQGQQELAKPRWTAQPAHRQPNFVSSSHPPTSQMYVQAQPIPTPAFGGAPSQTPPTGAPPAAFRSSPPVFRRAAPQLARISPRRAAGPPSCQQGARVRGLTPPPATALVTHAVAHAVANHEKFVLEEKKIGTKIIGGANGLVPQDAQPGVTPSSLAETAFKQNVLRLRGGGPPEVPPPTGIFHTQVDGNGVDENGVVLTTRATVGENYRESAAPGRAVHRESAGGTRPRSCTPPRGLDMPLLKPLARPSSLGPHGRRPNALARPAPRRAPGASGVVVPSSGMPFHSGVGVPAFLANQSRGGRPPLPPPPNAANKVVVATISTPADHMGGSGRRPLAENGATPAASYQPAARPDAVEHMLPPDLRSVPSRQPSQSAVVESSPAQLTNTAERGIHSSVAQTPLDDNASHLAVASEFSAEDHQYLGEMQGASPVVPGTTTSAHAPQHPGTARVLGDLAFRPCVVSPATGPAQHLPHHQQILDPRGAPLLSDALAHYPLVHPSIMSQIPQIFASAPFGTDMQHPVQGAAGLLLASAGGAGATTSYSGRPSYNNSAWTTGMDEFRLAAPPLPQTHSLVEKLQDNFKDVCDPRAIAMPSITKVEGLHRFDGSRPAPIKRSQRIENVQVPR